MSIFLQPLQTVTVGSSVSSVTFSSIPQGYTDLVIKASTRSDANDGGNYKYGTISVNGSTSNESSTFLYGNGSSTGSARDTVIYFWSASNLATSSTFGNFEVYIPNYTSSNYKSILVDIVTESNATGAYQNLEAGLWSNTSAITSLTFTSGGNFVQYSKFSLYGVLRQGI